MIWFGDVEHGRVIAHAAGTGYDPEVNRVIARITVAGNLRGGFIFTNYNKTAVHVHNAGFDPRWCSRELLALVFDYAFNQLKVERVFATVASTNTRALKIDLRAGFEKVATVPFAVEGGDMIVLSMSRERCKWLKLAKRYLQRHQELAA